MHQSLRDLSEMLYSSMSYHGKIPQWETTHINMIKTED